MRQWSYLTAAVSTMFPVSHSLKSLPLDEIEDIGEYIYLGRLLNMSDDLRPEIARRRRTGLAAFNGATQGRNI